MEEAKKIAKKLYELYNNDKISDDSFDLLQEKLQNQLVNNKNYTKEEWFIIQRIIDKGE